MAQATRSLVGVQERVAEAVLDADLGTTHLEGYDLPTPPGDLFTCSATPLRDDDIDYEGFVFRCDLDDQLFLDPDDVLPLVVFEHVVASAPQMRPARFAAFLSTWHGQVWGGEAPASDWATPYVCDARNVRNEHSVRFRIVQCWRRRPDLPGVYDLLIRSTILGRLQPGVVSTYLMFGTSQENGVKLMRSVLNTIRLRP
jgi:hypothetical protein